MIPSTFRMIHIITTITRGVDMRRKVSSLLLVVVLFFGMLPMMPQKAEAASWATIQSGKYYLRNVATGKFLNVCDAGNWNNCNVDNWYFNGCSAQVWTITGNSNSYKVQPGCSSTRVLNQWGDNVVSGHNVCLWDNTNHPSQRWVFQAVDAANGIYVVRCAGNTNCVLDVNEYGNVCVCNYAGRDSQKWVLSRAEVAIPARYYSIYNALNGKYMMVVNYGDYNNCNVVVGTYNGLDVMKWYISGSATFSKVKPKNTVSRVLNQWGDNVVAGHNVCLWDDTNHPSQRWVFEEVKVNGLTGYVIHCAGNLGCVLDISNMSVFVNTYNGSRSQIWYLSPTQ